MRFFFALMVFGSHLQFFNFEEDLLFKELYYRGISEGYLGVSFFFILSGFILSLNYDDKLLNKQVSFKDFWVARIARVYPLHLFTLLIAVLLVVDSTEQVSEFFSDPALSVSKFLSNATLIHSFIPDGDYFFSYNSPSWSISDEMFFYFAFPFIVILLVRNRLLLKIGWVSFLAIPVLMYYSSEDTHHKIFYINPFFRIVDFLLGITLFQLYRRRYFSKLYSTNLLATLIEILSVGLFVVFFYVHNSIPQVYRFSCFYWIPMAAVIGSFAHQAGYMSKLLSIRFMVVLGEISFSFYLIHQLFIKLLVDKNMLYGITNSNYVLSALILFVSLVASYFMHKYIELPCNRYVKHKCKTAFYIFNTTSA